MANAIQALWFIFFMVLAITGGTAALLVVVYVGCMAMARYSAWRSGRTDMDELKSSARRAEDRVEMERSEK
jgi:hypothetical protein